MSPNHSRTAHHLVFWSVLEVGFNHLALFGLEDFRHIVEHDAVCGGIALLDAQGAAVDLDTLAVGVFGRDAEGVFSGDDAVVVFPRTRLAFLDEVVKL